MDDPGPDVQIALPWRRAAIVCQKCAGKRPDGLDHDGHVILRQQLKAALDDAGVSKKHVRVAQSTCLGLCPDAGVTVLIPGAEGQPTVVRVVHDRADRDAVVALLRVDIPRPL